MSRVAVDIFRGMSPKISPRALPNEMSQSAVNARLLSGDLESYKDFSTVITLAKGTPINTVVPIGPIADGYWLQWSESELGASAVNVDAVPGPVPGDETYRTFITGLDKPRFTNLDLATNPAYRGSSPLYAYPYRTEVLGVQPPDTAPTVNQPAGPTGPSQTYSYSGQNFTGWAQNYYDNGVGSRRRWQISSGAGNPAPSWYFEFAQNPFDPLYTTTAFSLSTAASFTATFTAIANDSGSGAIPAIGFSISSAFDGYRKMNGPVVEWNAVANLLRLQEKGGTVVDSAMYNFVPGVWYLTTITGTQATDSATQAKGWDIVATVALADSPSAVVATVTGFVAYAGEAFACYPRHQSNDDFTNNGYYDNVNITVTQYVSATDQQEVAYVYTKVNSFNQESAPSPTSAIVSVSIVNDSAGNPDAISTVLGSIPPFDPSEDVVSYYLYRAVTTANGVAVFQFDQSLPASSSHSVDFSDSLLDIDLGDDLQTTIWSPPPEDLQGLISLPNGIMAGFTGNQLCLSAQNYPHAWPVAYRLTTDYPIVALGAIDTSIVVLTTGPVYIASGTDPSDFSMEKDTFIQGCSSKRGVVFLRGVGVVFPSPEGVCVYSGLGSLRVLTKDLNLLSERDWSALEPSSIIAFAHESYYYFFYNTGSVKGGYVLDTAPNGFGLIALDFHASAGHVDTQTDTLYLVLDNGAINGVSVLGDTVYSWDTAVTYRPYSWLSKKYQLPIPSAYFALQVRAFDYSDINVTLYMDGVAYCTKQITGEKELIVPPLVGTTFEFELAGTSRVTQFQISHAMEELT